MLHLCVYPLFGTDNRVQTREEMRYAEYSHIMVKTRKIKLKEIVSHECGVFWSLVE